MKRLKEILAGVVLLLLASWFEHSQRRQPMNADTRKVWKWWIIAALLLGVVRLLTGCAVPMTAPEPMYYPYRLEIVDSLPGGNYGITGCDTLLNQPVVLIIKGLGTEFLAVRAHENEHVRQMAREGNGCRNFMKRYHEEPVYRLHAEVEAYCRGLLIGVRLLGWNYEEGIAIYAGTIWENRRLPGQTQQEITEMLSKACNQMIKEAPHENHSRGVLPELPP